MATSRLIATMNPVATSFIALWNPSQKVGSGMRIAGMVLLLQVRSMIPLSSEASFRFMLLGVKKPGDCLSARPHGSGSESYVPQQCLVLTV